MSLQSLAPGQMHLTREQAATRYSVSGRTIARWQNDPILAFPTAKLVRGRHFFLISDLEAWEQNRPHASRKEAA